MQLTVRADSASYSKAVLATAKFDVRFSVTARQDKRVRAAINATTPGTDPVLHSGRRRRLRLPQSWPWAAAITTALTNITAIPMRC